MVKNPHSLLKYSSLQVQRMKHPSESFESPHFSIQSLAPGVHAAIAKNGGAAIANAGIIDLGDSTVVFDTFMTLQAAKGLSLAARRLTGREVETVINSHYHNDHTWGNQVFSPHARIISTRQTRELLRTEGKEEMDWARQVSAERLENFQKQYEQAKSEQEISEAEMWVGYYKGLVQDLPSIKIQLPEITFENRLSLYGSARSLHLLAFENAHTGNDLVLHLPEDGVIFMSDLLFVGCHPYLAECDVHRLLESLEHIRSLEAEVYVPGHGPAGSKNDIELMIAYVNTCIEKARELASKGKTSPEQISKEKVPAQFKAWELSRFYHVNLQALCQNTQ